MKDKLKNKIISVWTDFVSLSSSSKIDYEINFIDRKENKFLIKRGLKMRYLPIFEQTNNRKITALYSISLYHFQLILNKVQNELLSDCGFILHAAASEYQKKAIVFIGNRGAGKSTIVNLLNPEFKPLSDDAVIIKKEGEKFYFYHSVLWENESCIKKSSKRYEIGKVFILKKAEFIEIDNEKNVEIIFNLLLQSLMSSVLKEHQPSIEYKKFSSFIKNRDLFYYLYFPKNKERLIDYFKNHMNKNHRNHLIVPKV